MSGSARWYPKKRNALLRNLSAILTGCLIPETLYQEDHGSLGMGDVHRKEKTPPSPLHLILIKGS